MNRPRTARLLFALSAAAALVVPGPYLIENAGPAINVHGEFRGQNLVSITGAQTYPSDSQLFMTTVTQFGSPEVGVPGAQAALALFSRDDQLIPVRALYRPSQTAEGERKRDLAAMDESQNAAAVVALEHAGYKVPMKLTVVGTDGGGPAVGIFKEGDVLRTIAVAGEKRDVTTFSDLSKLLFATAPGTEVTVGVERGGKPVELKAKTAAYPPDSTGWVHPGSLLGVRIASSDLKFPVNVHYDVREIGGPSAGTMFSLGIYDSLTPGSLAGNAKIAGTGTISYNGDVGPIGGIEHKLVGAYKQGARNFLAPAENCAETVGYVPDGMKVWAIRTDDEAIAAARAIGAGQEPKVPQCAEVAKRAAAQPVR